MGNVARNQPCQSALIATYRRGCAMNNHLTTTGSAGFGADRPGRRSRCANPRITIRRGTGPVAVAGTTAANDRPFAYRHRRTALTCSIFYTDVSGFGHPRRDDNDRATIRAALYRILEQVFDDSGVPWGGCIHEDRGDGVLTVVPPGMPTALLVDPLLPLLAADLRRYNRRAADPVRIALRAALHVGPVSADPNGLNGQALIHAARMLDAPALRKSLAATGAELAFITSDHVYQTVVRHAARLLDPDAFQPVRAHCKDAKLASWIYTSNTPFRATWRERIGRPYHLLRQYHYP
jgi:hypothetical protein